MTALSFILFAISVLIGIALLILGIGGNWVVLAGILAAIALHPQAAITLQIFLILLSLCILAEIIEWAAVYLGAKRRGVSTAGILGAAVGGFLGALAGGVIIPVFGIIPGSFIGTFAGAMWLELYQGGSQEEAMRRGWAAFIARIFSVVFKITLTFTMAITGLFFLI